MLTYIAYLDEFGHSGPYVSRIDLYHKTSPVFGLGGIILPASNARKFSAWFHWFKKELFKYEINQSGIPSYHWEKKGSKLFKTKGKLKYKNNNLKILILVLKSLQRYGGYLIYYGIQKYLSPDQHNSNNLYTSVLHNILNQIHLYCSVNNNNAMVILDENGGASQRTRVVDKSALAIFGDTSLFIIIEPVLQAESHLYQNLQCADWICAILTRTFNYISSPHEYPELIWTIADGYKSVIDKYKINSKFNKK